METISWTSGQLAGILGVARYHITNAVSYLGIEPFARVSRTRLFNADAARRVLAYLVEHETPGLRDRAAVRSYADASEARAEDLLNKATSYDIDECEARVRDLERQIEDLTSELEYRRSVASTARALKQLWLDATRQTRAAQALAKAMEDE